MALTLYNRESLFRELFGISARFVAVSAVNAGVLLDGEMPAFGDIQVLETDQAIRQSELGHPIFSEVVFERENGEQYDVPNAPMIDCRLAKNIVRTSLLKRMGTVKELISADDWQVTIRGFLVDSDDRYPINQVRELRQWFELEESLKVTSEILNEMGIYNLVLQELDLPDPENYSNFQAFTLSCLSDEPVELELNDERLAAENA